MIGQTKTVLLSQSEGRSIGVVTEIIVQTVSEKSDSPRLVFNGPVKFDDQCSEHLQSVVLPMVDKITDAMDLPKTNYRISAVNVDASALLDRGIMISGFSADLPIALAMLSSALDVTLRQDAVSTGHIASPEGHLACVSGIPAKLEAAIASSEVTQFVLPDPDRDGSSKTLTPREYESITDALISSSGKIRITPVLNFYEAIEVFLDDESIVMASLRRGFFHRRPKKHDHPNPIGETIHFFSNDNKKRFRDVLERMFLSSSIQKAKELLQAYVDYHIREKRYPKSFGGELFRLMLSLPPSIGRLEKLCPLIPTEAYIKLIQHAGDADFEDIQHLHKAVFEEPIERGSLKESPSREADFDEIGAERDLLERILQEISEENLTEKIRRPFDEARSRYVLETVKVKNGSAFNDTIVRYYAHLCRYTGIIEGLQNKDGVAHEAIEAVDNAFKRKGGYEAALSEGIYAINGGMRMVLDAMTEYLKESSSQKYINGVCKRILDPLDWDTKVRLMEVFLKHINERLPGDLKDQPAKKLARQWEYLLKLYARSMSDVSSLIRRL